MSVQGQPGSDMTSGTRCDKGDGLRFHPTAHEFP